MRQDFGASRVGWQTLSWTESTSHPLETLAVSMRSRWIRVALMAASTVGLLAIPEARATEGRGGHSSSRAARTPQFSARPQAYRAPRMSHSAAPAHASSARMSTPANNAQARAKSAQSHSKNTQAALNTNHARSNVASTASTGTVNPATNSAVSSTNGTAGGVSANTYTYGYGRGARPYTAYGYGRGYRRSYYGRGYGYGRSQGNNRAIVARLRSVNASLARIAHDYRGHRVQAMHAISLAIRQLSHGSMGYRGVGFRSGGNNGLGMGIRQGGGGGLGVNGARQPMSQVQSDARISQSLRNLQGINMQLNSQGYRAGGYAGASTHVQQAIRHLHTALSIR